VVFCWVSITFRNAAEDLFGFHQPFLVCHYSIQALQMQLVS